MLPRPRSSADGCLQPLTDWIETDTLRSLAASNVLTETLEDASDDASGHGDGNREHPSYWYSGVCPETGVLLKLPRTRLAEAVAKHLMQQLAADPVHHQEGKMYGILIVRSPHQRSYHERSPNSSDSHHALDSASDNDSDSASNGASVLSPDHVAESRVETPNQNAQVQNAQAHKVQDYNAHSQPAPPASSESLSSLYLLKAFSGLLDRQSHLAGWVPPIPGRGQVALAEAQTLTQLDAIKHQILSLQQLPERQLLLTRQQQHHQERQTLHQIHQHRKRDRHQRRHQAQQALDGDDLQRVIHSLNRESQQDGIERRHLKRQHDQAIAPLQQHVQAADSDLHQLKAQRKRLSQQLQTQMHAAYQLTNFAGTSASLEAIASRPLPTGTGDCCAPKLLHYAAVHNLTPIAMAEFWWDPAQSASDSFAPAPSNPAPSNPDPTKIHGHFYGACAERCQPIMGFLLSGLTPTAPSSNSSQSRSPKSYAVPSISEPQSVPNPLAVLYEDEWLLAINKPAHLLSVPGRYLATQDSVLTRLRPQFSLKTTLIPVHRLDQATSGVLLFAKTPEVHRQLSYQFQQRQVHKVYEALMPSIPLQPQGTIDLPLWGDPCDRPKQQVEFTRGKPSITHYRVLSWPTQSQPSQSQSPQSQPSQSETLTAYTRIEFVPITGRTHQIRVHAASPAGLGCPIVGDRLYGYSLKAPRLYLHARALTLTHPRTQTFLQVEKETPF